MVTIEGEVNNPGIYTYDSGSRLSDYIDYSGGLIRCIKIFKLCCKPQW